MRRRALRLETGRKGSEPVSDKRPGVALTPPMGWNSWDVYGASVTEDEVLRNAEFLASHLKHHGWTYVVVDIQWSEPTADSSTYHPFVPLVMDEFSRLLPAPNRFPSAEGGAGFAPLAERIHALGLAFGIHVMRGIPRQAADAKTAILGSDANAADIAATDSTCPWNTDMYGVDPTADGAKAYYDSLFALYASWGVDFVKVDDALLPYATGEIELIRGAIDRCGREIVLSLSCGPLDVVHAQHVQAHAQMWRMSGDFWDDWRDLLGMFDLCAAWSPYVGPGSWPDADMLPLGHLAIRSEEHGVRERWTRFSRDEQIAMLTLWCIFRSPLMLGCELPSLDEWTLTLLTNDEVLGVSQHGHGARQVVRDGHLIVWVAEADPGVSFVAAFNTGPVAASFALSTSALGLASTVALRDLWVKVDQGFVTGTLEVEIPSHGARLLRATTRR
jgi:hypothetical protein